MFFKQKYRPIIVRTYSEACDLLRRSGVNVVRRQADGRTVSSSIVIVNGMSWLFNGDNRGFTVSRKIKAPTDWNEEAFYSWQLRKNCVVAIYMPEDSTFIIASHILIDGGVELKNLGRVVVHFGSVINDFLDAMGMGSDHLCPLELK